MAIFAPIPDLPIYIDVSSDRASVYTWLNHHGIYWADGQAPEDYTYQENIIQITTDPTSDTPIIRTGCFEEVSTILTSRNLVSEYPVTLPFPTENFYITCGDTPAVREWLHNNGADYNASGDCRTAHLQARVLGVRLGAPRPRLLGTGNLSVSDRDALITQAQLYEVTQPIPKPTLSNEEIFTMFLKHHRKYAPFKRVIISAEPITVAVTVPILVAINWEGQVNMWSNLNDEWNNLVTHFNLTGTIDIGKL